MNKFKMFAEWYLEPQEVCNYIPKDELNTSTI
jgi:hypothetical protein